MLADALDDGSCVKTGGFKSLGLTGSVEEITSCKAHYPTGDWHYCEVDLVEDDGYSYADFTFPVALDSAGDAVRVELQYNLNNFACLGDHDYWSFREYTSDQWLSTSMVRSTRYYICTRRLINWNSTDITLSDGLSLARITPIEGEPNGNFI